MVKSSYYVSLQPSEDLEPDDTQPGGPLSVFPAGEQTAGDVPGEVTAAFSDTQCYTFDCVAEVHSEAEGLLPDLTS